MMTWMCFRTELEGPRLLFLGLRLGNHETSAAGWKSKDSLGWIGCFCFWRSEHVYWDILVKLANLSQSQMAQRVQPQLRHCWEVCDMTFSELPQPFNLNGYKKVWRKKTRKYRFRWLELEFPTQNWYSWVLHDFEVLGVHRVVSAWGWRSEYWWFCQTPLQVGGFGYPKVEGQYLKNCSKEKVKVWRDSNSFVTLGYCVNTIYIYMYILPCTYFK